MLVYHLQCFRNERNHQHLARHDTKLNDVYIEHCAHLRPTSRMNMVLVTEGKSAIVEGKAKGLRRLRESEEASDLRGAYWLEINVESVRWFDEVATRGNINPPSTQECWAFDKASLGSHIQCL